MHKRLWLKRAAGPEAADPFLAKALDPNGSVLSVSDVVAESEKYIHFKLSEKYTLQDQKNTIIRSREICFAESDQRNILSTVREIHFTESEKYTLRN